jgi:AraC-like DNA-binding protein
MDDVPQSITLFFTEPGHFVTAVPHNGTSRRVLITGHGRFRARLTWIALESLRVVAGEESLPRIAFVTVPQHMILVVLQRKPYPPAIWGEIVMQAGEILTFGPGSSAHARTEGPSRWATLLVPVRDLARFGRAMVGREFVMPTRIQRWLPAKAPGRLLQRLHAATIRAVERGHPELINQESAHGLDQQIIEALIGCVSTGSVVAETPVMRRYREIMFRFEALLEKHDHDNLRAAELGTSLGISQWMLCRACRIHLGMSPSNYLRLRRKQRVHHAKRNGARRVPGLYLHQ